MIHVCNIGNSKVVCNISVCTLLFIIICNIGFVIFGIYWSLSISIFQLIMYTINWISNMDKPLNHTFNAEAADAQWQARFILQGCAIDQEAELLTHSLNLLLQKWKKVAPSHWPYHVLPVSWRFASWQHLLYGVTFFGSTPLHILVSGSHELLKV